MNFSPIHFRVRTPTAPPRPVWHCFQSASFDTSARILLHSARVALKTESWAAMVASSLAAVSSSATEGFAAARTAAARSRLPTTIRQIPGSDW